MDRIMPYVTKRNIVVVMVIIAGLLAFQGSRNVVEFANSGIVSVSSADKNTELYLRDRVDSIEEDDTSPPMADKKIGVGSATIRLTPGDYQIIGRLDGSESIFAAPISSRKQTNIRITLQKPAAPTTIAAVPARFILPLPGGFNYLDTSTNQVMRYELRSGTVVKLPQFSNRFASNQTISNIYWVTADRAYYLQGSTEWWYADEKGSQPFRNTSDNAIRGQAAAAKAAADRQLANTRSDQFTETRSPIPVSLSANRSGVVSFAAGRQVGITSDKSTDAKLIATIDTPLAETTISPTGGVVVREISLEDHDHDGKGGGSPVILYVNGVKSEPEELSGGSNFAWSTDGRRLSYVNEKGFYAYDVFTKKTEQILSGRTTYSVNTAWLSPTRIAYTQDKSIWYYDIRTHSAKKICNYEGNLAAGQSISVADGGRSIYFATAVNNQGEGGYVYKVNID